MIIREKIGKLAEALAQPIREADEFYQRLKIGTVFWVPCSGNEKKGNVYGHTGRLDTFLGLSRKGLPKWEYGDWIIAEDARKLGVKIPEGRVSVTICDDCRKTAENK